MVTRRRHTRRRATPERIAGAVIPLLLLVGIQGCEARTPSTVWTIDGDNNHGDNSNGDTGNGDSQEPECGDDADCNENAGCGGGSCGCYTGYANCDGLWGNGCEVDIYSNALHCGECNNPCDDPPEDTCVSGTLTTHPALGTCALPGCSYSPETTACPHGCAPTVAACLAEAVTLTLQPPPAESEDTYLEIDSGWTESADVVHDGEQLKVGVDGDGATYDRRRSLLRFDVSGAGLFPGDQINAATLKLLIRMNENLTGGSRSLDIHRMLIPWVEEEASWNRPYTDAPLWSGAEPDGETAVAAPSASLIRDQQTGWYEWDGDGVGELVQFWVDHPEENHGLLIKLAAEPTDAEHCFRFHSSDATLVGADGRPVLEIVYQSVE